MKSETAASVAMKRRFEFDDESVVLPNGQGVYFDYPNFPNALRDEVKNASNRQSGRIRQAASVFQSSPRLLYISVSFCNCILVFGVFS